MTRKKKNIIMILLLVVLVSLSVFNIYFISTKENNKNINIISNNSTFNKEDHYLNKNDSSKENTNDNSSKDTEEKDNNEPSINDDSDSNSQNNNKNNDFIPRHKNDHIRDNNFPKQDFRNHGIARNNVNNKTIYYLFLTTECIFISIVITYLIMSNFNKKDLKETFKGDKKLIYTILAIIIASLLLNVESIITKSILNNNVKTDSNITEKINTNSNNEL